MCAVCEYEACMCAVCEYEACMWLDLRAQVKTPSYLLLYSLSQANLSKSLPSRDTSLKFSSFNILIIKFKI